MQKVVNFPRARQQRESIALWATAQTDANKAELLEAIKTVQSGVRQEIRSSLLLLDLAAQRSRLLVNQIADPSSRQVLESKITTIEQLIQLARDAAREL